MIDKRTGKVAYAVMTFGGFLGIGDEHSGAAVERAAHIPGSRRYETQQSRRTSSAMPRAYDRDGIRALIGRDWERNVHEYYGASPYW